MLTAYRIGYGFVLVILLANVLTANGYRGWPIYVPLLLLSWAATLCALLLCVVLFFRVGVRFVFVLVLVWEALFIWYGWFGLPLSLNRASGHRRLSSSRKIAQYASVT